MRTKLILASISLIALWRVQGTQKIGAVSEVVDQKNQAPPQNDVPGNDINNNNNNVDQSGTDTVASNPDGSNIPTNATEAESTGTTEDDQNKEYVNVTGMSDSLADYVIDWMTHSGNTSKAEEAIPSATNDTHPSAANASSASASDSSATSQDSENVPTHSAGSSTGKDQTGVPKPGEPQQDHQASHSDQNKDDDKGLENEENLLASSNKSIPSPKKEKVNCNTEVDLQDYCTVDEPVRAYFGGDTTFRGLQSPLFNMNIVQRLMSCPRGQWCLENELDVFKGMEKKFYIGPLCEDSMWECIYDIMMRREDCPDKQFMFVVDAVNLMCDMFITMPTGEHDKACFAQALTAMHVTYADFLANSMTAAHSEAQVSCEGHPFRMTKTYLCADEYCGGLFEARLAMEKFARWGWFMGKVDQAIADCNLKNYNICEHMQPEKTEMPRPDETWFGMTTSSFWPETTPSTSTSYPEEGESTTRRVDENDTDLNRLSQEDESLMVALSVASAVGLLFMVLGLIFWRRNRRRNLYYYRTAPSDGYDKVPSDEAHLLSRSSD